MEVVAPRARQNARERAGAWTGAAAAAGGVFALASSPTNFYVGLWLGMAGLAYSLEEPLATRWAKGRLGGAGRGLAFGTVANIVALRFVPDVVARFTPLPWAAGALALLLLAAAQGLRWLVAGVVREQLARLGLASWAAFAAGVYGGTFVPAVFPWNPAGGATPWPAMIQLADVLGDRGVSLLMAATAGLLASGVRLAREGRLARGAVLGGIAVAIPLATFEHGRFRIAEVEALRAEATSTTVALVQPGTGAVLRWDPGSRRPILDRLTSLTRSAEHRGATLTIWPEAAYPIAVGHASRRCPTGEWAVLPFGVRGPVLTGLVTSGAAGETFNSAAICKTDGTLTEPYDKIHLLWFGEAVPLADQIPWIRRTFMRSGGLFPGEHGVVQEAGPVRAGVLNCFEDILSSAGREAMVGAPNLLVNVTNDAWFAGSAESEMHLRVAVMRAVEERRDLVRAVNLGPTTWVDAAGQVRGRYDSGLPGTLLAQPALLETPPTPFGRWGDAPTALAVTLVVACWLAAQRARRHRA